MAVDYAEYRDQKEQEPENISNEFSVDDESGVIRKLLNGYGFWIKTSLSKLT